MAGDRSLILPFNFSHLQSNVCAIHRYEKWGRTPRDFGVSDLEGSPAAGAEVKVLLSALGALLSIDVVLFVAGTADNIGDSQGAVCTHNGCGHYYSSEDRMADQQ